MVSKSCKDDKRSPMIIRSLDMEGRDRSTAGRNDHTKWRIERVRGEGYSPNLVHKKHQSKPDLNRVV